LRWSSAGYILAAHYQTMKTALLKICILGMVFVLSPLMVGAQDRLSSMPGHERYQRVSRAATNLYKSGALSVTWTNGGQAFDYRQDGKNFRYDIATRTATELPTNAPVQRSRRSDASTPPRPERGRQYTSAKSPDGQFTARYRDHNVWLRSTNDTNQIAVTTEGNAKERVKFGSASWVYGEELFQSTAMWWSSNSQKLAFYRFDESKVPDFYLQLGQTKIVSTADIEPYAKAGAANPVVDIFIYDLTTKKTVRVDVRNGQEFEDSVVGHYVYGVSWSREGELLFHRTNRRQNIMELCAADAVTGKVRAIVREEWPESWTENSPPMRFLKDGQRFLWTSERNGWANFYLYDLGGKLITPVTQHTSFEVANIVRVDEDAGVLYYMARDGDNPMKLQLHRVGLDGRNDQRLTNPRYHHSVDVAPDSKHFIDVAQTHDEPPFTQLLTTEGDLVAELARSELTGFKKLGLKKVELFSFKAADGETELYGMLHFPSNFRSAFKKYPLLVSVYAGPATTGARETFTTPNLLTEYGFLVATLDSRSASGRGKKFLDSIYLKLGQPEIDDQAAGVKFLGQRRYVDRQRVGIFGTSYGGTASALALMRYPEVFQAACASSAVVDFRNYDTIYTERYMGLPQENKLGYDAANPVNYITNLQGRLMIFYGTADNNVHPNNAMQLIAALQKAKKSFEVQAGPDLGHTSLGRDRMMEFFIENLGRK
jgi:dipeptidyl-peptidase-4